MKGFLKLLRWLEFYFRSSRFVWARWLSKRLATSSSLDPAEVVPSTDGGLLFTPTGFNGSFNPAVHRALPAVQEAAVHAIFNLFNLKHIPGEYRAILIRKPDPTDAWEEFCHAFGLRVERLGLLARVEVDRLHQVVGLLVELAQLRPELDAYSRERILSALKDRKYDSAEELIDIARSIITLVRNAATLKNHIIFPHYEAFVERLHELLANLDNTNKADADQALRYEQGFRDFQSQFDVLIAHLDAEIVWMLKFWPDNDWGKDNVIYKDGLVARKEDLEERLKSDADARIPALIGELQETLDHLMELIDQIKANYDGGTFDPPADTTAAAVWKEWVDAATIFGFGESAEPTSDEIKRVFRKLALKYHPDHSVDPTATEKFRLLVEARAVLERYAATSKPDRPAK